jgi:hypothetical protein
LAPLRTLRPRSRRCTRRIDGSTPSKLRASSVTRRTRPGERVRWHQRPPIPLARDQVSKRLASPCAGGPERAG